MTPLGSTVNSPSGSRIRRILYSSFLAATLSGCGSTPDQTTDLTIIQSAATTSDSEKTMPTVGSQTLVENVDLISVDLINALSQIGGLHPSETLLQMESPATHFGKALRTVLEQAGYGLRILPNADTAVVIAHAVTKLGEERDGILNSYQIVVGEIRLKREYFEQPYGVTPSSNMFVIGANPAEITLNDELFEIASTRTAEITPVESAADAAALVEPETTVTLTSAIDLQTAEAIVVLPSRTDDNSAQAFATESRSAEIEPSEKVPLIQSLADKDISRVKIKGNMYELGKSNFAEFLVDYSDMKRDVLVFANDSMRLGRENKRVLSTFISDFLEDSDVISVIGCSHGRTNLNNGNAILATGRAQRVKEALMFSGIAENKIMEEGCWAPTYFDDVMPRRGVVITHKRDHQAASPSYRVRRPLSKRHPNSRPS